MGRYSLDFIVSCEGDSKSDGFRPNKDETQWWMRRDAHCRISYACLLSLQSKYARPDLVGKCHLFYPADASYMQMEIRNSKSSIRRKQEPIERSWVELWRQASQQCDRGSGTVIMNMGSGNIEVVAKLVRTEVSLVGKKRNISDVSSSQLELWDKSDILNFLSTHCTSEFLKRHRLNSSRNSILKKKNKRDLLSIFEDWKQNDSKALEDIPKSSGSTSEQVNKFYNAFFEILKSYPKGKTGVLILHENCKDELPIFASRLETDIVQNSSRLDRLVCVLGGVRDMEKDEYDALFSVCKELNLKIICCNLGHTPEFSSKIIYALHCHNLSGRLEPAINQLIENSGETNMVSSELLFSMENDMLRGTLSKNSTCVFKQTLFFKSRLQSSELSLSQDIRSKLFPIVQLLVNTLWRSKLIQQQQNLPDAELHNNVSDSLVNVVINFSDDKWILIDQINFLKEMAIHHRAAPSEFQIIQTLLDTPILDEMPKFSDSEYESIYVGIGNFEGVQEHPNIDFISEVYDSPCSCSVNEPALVPNENQIRLVYVYFEDASMGPLEQKICRNSNFFYWKHIVPDDLQHLSRGAIIALFQHWHYHGRLLPSIRSLCKN